MAFKPIFSVEVDLDLLEPTGKTCVDALRAALRELTGPEGGIFLGGPVIVGGVTVGAVGYGPAEMFRSEAIKAARADRIARALYPDEVPPAEDCKAEVGREGEPCRACAEQTARWGELVAKVRAAVEA